MTGRAAALPQPGYTQPRRLFLEGECRVRAFPEDGGAPVDIDLGVLPVARPLQEWLAGAVAGATGPSGPLRSATSQRNVLSIVKRFTRYLAGLQRPPQEPSQLRRSHVDGFVLAGGKCLHRDLGGLRSMLRHAVPAAPDDFWARLSAAHAPKLDDRVSSYSEAEFRRIIARCRAELREAAARIRGGRAELAAWRAGAVDESDRLTWQRGFYLDYIDRHGDVPRAAAGQPASGVTRHGGPAALMALLHLTFDEMTAAAVLLICLTGQNLGTLSKATIRHLRPDGHSGRPASAMVDLVKPRRGLRAAQMSVALLDTVDGQPPADQLATPFGVYTLLIELGAATRVQAGTDRLLTCYNHKVGKGAHRFRIGLPHLAIFQWSRSGRANLFCDPTPGSDAPVREPLHLDSAAADHVPGAAPAAGRADRADPGRRISRSQSRQHRRVSAPGRRRARAAGRAGPRVRPLRVLSPGDVARTPSDPGAVAAAHDMSVDAVADLVAGRLDTVLAACVDNLHGPHTEPGQPCTASFLLCLSCPCARATPAHLPVQVLVHDALTARRQQMPPLAWAQRFAAPTTQLDDVLAQFTPGAVADARANATAAEKDLVDRFLNRELDWA